MRAAGTSARCVGSSRLASDCATFGVSGQGSASQTKSSAAVSFDRQPEKEGKHRYSIKCLQTLQFEVMSVSFF